MSKSSADVASIVAVLHRSSSNIAQKDCITNKEILIDSNLNMQSEAHFTDPAATKSK